MLQRQNTETIMRDLYERYEGKRLQDEFDRRGFTEQEVKELFDSVDEKFGTYISCDDPEERNAAQNGAATYIAAVVANKPK